MITPDPMPENAIDVRLLGTFEARTRRRVLHARVARQLVQIGDREHELPVEQIAFHYRAPGDARQAAHFLTLAGQRAAALYLWHFNRLEEAAEYARRPLTLAEAAGATLETAQACEILAMA